MSQAVPSVTHRMTLQQVLARLRDHLSVHAIVIVGSLRRGTLSPASDYDLVLVLERMPVPIHVGYTSIDGRMTDVIFVEAETIERLEANTGGVPVDGADGSLARWLQSGDIVFDRHGAVSRLQQTLRLREESEPPGFSAKYASWFSINYNLNHNKRMLRSDVPIYLMALDLRLLYSVFELLPAYLRFRDLPWRGEKDVLQYLAEHDAACFAMLQAYLAETDRARKLTIYERLASRVVEPVGALWPEEATALQFSPDAELTPSLVEDGLTFWHQLVTGPADVPPHFADHAD